MEQYLYQDLVATADNRPLIPALLQTHIANNNIVASKDSNTLQQSSTWTTNNNNLILFILANKNFKGEYKWQVKMKFWRM